MIIFNQIQILLFQYSVSLLGLYSTCALMAYSDTRTPRYMGSNLIQTELTPQLGQITSIVQLDPPLRTNAQSDLTTLCNYDIAHGNYPAICLDILKNAKITQSKIYNYNGEYNFHIMKDGQLLYVCMAASNFKNKIAFAFLQEIKKKFREKYSIEEIMAAKDYDMSAGFSEIYKNQINFYNSTQVTDNKDVLMKQLTSLQEVMSQNIEKVLQNQQKVQLIVKKTAKLSSIADEIKKNATKMKKDAFWKRNKCKLAIGGFVVAACACLIILI